MRLSLLMERKKMKWSFSEAKSIFNSQFSMSSKNKFIISLFEMRRKSSLEARKMGKFVRKLNFSSNKNRGGRKKQQSEATINCVFLYITIGSEWIFYCFDIILEEYLIGSRASWEFLSKYCALQKKCWKQNVLISFCFRFGSFHLALRLLENSRSLQARLNMTKMHFTRQSLI